MAEVITDIVYISILLALTKSSSSTSQTKIEGLIQSLRSFYFAIPKPLSNDLTCFN